VALLATSSGGILAYRFAASYPQRTSALILSNVPPSAPVDNAGAMRRNPWPLRLSLTVCLKYSRPWSETCVRDFLRSTFHRQQVITDDVVRQYYDFNRRPDSRTPSSMTGIMRDDALVRGFLAKITAPTLLLWGAEDHVLPPAAARLLAERLSATQAELQILDDVAHYPPLEAPAEVAAASRAFLTRALAVP
jgi:pimeloyl-ACP methyl ester carboxylesterase